MTVKQTIVIELEVEEPIERLYLFENFSAMVEVLKDAQPEGLVKGWEVTVPTLQIGTKALTRP